VLLCTDGGASTLAWLDDEIDCRFDNDP